MTPRSKRYFKRKSAEKRWHKEVILPWAKMIQEEIDREILEMVIEMAKQEEI